jgi:hypothetical protein
LLIEEVLTIAGLPLTAVFFGGFVLIFVLPVPMRAIF